MAVEVKAGETYKAEGVRSGENWTMLKVKDKRKELAVFTDKGEAFHEGDMVKIVKITSVKMSARKGKDDKWYDTLSCNAEVEVNGAAPSGFTETDDEDGELPF
ncbi:MAG: hypothetical protein IJT62_04155 [Oscillospiraceae bacterium]|nr:hypothetical protein [Oscillospiraceae bacterium]